MRLYSGQGLKRHAWAASKKKGTSGTSLLSLTNSWLNVPLPCAAGVYPIQYPGAWGKINQCRVSKTMSIWICRTRLYIQLGWIGTHGKYTFCWPKCPCAMWNSPPGIKRKTCSLWTDVSTCGADESIPSRKSSDVSIGKLTINGHFSIAMLNYQGVSHIWVNYNNSLTWIKATDLSVAVRSWWNLPTILGHPHAIPSGSSASSP